MKEGRVLKALRILHCPRKEKMYRLGFNKLKMHAVTPKAAILKVWFTDNWESPKHFREVC